MEAFSAFVSHSSKDDAFIEILVESLARHGIDVWDDRQLRISEVWQEIVERRIRETQLTILVITPNSYTSEPVKGEIEKALYYRKPIVPILLRKLESWENWDDLKVKVRDITYNGLTHWQEGQTLSDEDIKDLVDTINQYRLTWIKTFTRRDPLEGDDAQLVANIEQMVVIGGQNALPYLAQKLLIGTNSVFEPPESVAVIRAIAAIGGDFARILLEFAMQSYELTNNNMPHIVEALGYVGNGATRMFLNTRMVDFQFKNPGLVKIGRNAMNRITVRLNFADNPNIQPRDE